MRLNASRYDFAFLVFGAQNVELAVEVRCSQFRVFQIISDLIATASRHSLPDSHSWSEGLNPGSGNISVDIDGSVFLYVNHNLIWVEAGPVLTAVNGSLRKGLRFQTVDHLLANILYCLLENVQRTHNRQYNGTALIDDSPLLHIRVAYDREADHVARLQMVLFGASVLG